MVVPHSNHQLVSFGLKCVRHIHFNPIVPLVRSRKLLPVERENQMVIRGSFQLRCLDPFRGEARPKEVGLL